MTLVPVTKKPFRRMQGWPTEPDYTRGAFFGKCEHRGVSCRWGSYRRGVTFDKRPRRRRR